MFGPLGSYRSLSPVWGRGGGGGGEGWGDEERLMRKGRKRALHLGTTRALSDL